MTTLAEIRAAVGDWLVERMELEFTPAEQRLYDVLRIPADGVIVTAESLAWALHEAGGDRGLCNPWAVEPTHTTIHEGDAAAILAALAAEGGPA